MNDHTAILALATILNLQQQVLTLTDTVVQLQQELVAAKTDKANTNE